MSAAAWFAALAIVCGSTIAGAVAMIVRPGLDVLALGAVVAMAGLAVAVAVGAVASRTGVERPKWALGLGQAVAAGWCLNAAALAVLMLTRMP